MRKEYSGDGPSGKVYLACIGTVFDVTGSENYTKGGPYGAFAGRDVSMACAYYSTDEKYLSMDFNHEDYTL